MTYSRFDDENEELDLFVNFVHNNDYYKYKVSRRDSVYENMLRLFKSI